MYTPQLQELLRAESEELPVTPSFSEAKRQTARIRAASIAVRAGKREREQEELIHMARALEDARDWVREMKNTRSTIKTELEHLGLQTSMMEQAIATADEALKRYKKE